MGRPKLTAKWPAIDSLNGRQLINWLNFCEDITNARFCWPKPSILTWKLESGAHLEK